MLIKPYVGVCGCGNEGLYSSTCALWNLLCWLTAQVRLGARLSVMPRMCTSAFTVGLCC